MARYGKLGTQYFDDAGNPLIEGKIFFFESGTDTEKDTFSDENQQIINTNPVILTAAGRQPNIFFTGSARAILTKNNDTQIEVRDPEGFTESSTTPPWNFLAVYNIPDVVVGSNNRFYTSIINGNQNLDPLTSESAWSEVRYIRIYNENETYFVGRIVEANDGKLYSSLADDNIGNDPITDNGTNWDNFTTEQVVARKTTSTPVVTNSVVLVEDTELRVTATRPGWWSYQAILRQESTAGSGLLLEIEVDSTDAFFQGQAIGNGFAIGTGGPPNSQVISQLSQGNPTGVAMLGYLNIEFGTIIVTGMFFGSDPSFDLTLKFAQNVAGGDNTFFEVNSMVKIDFIGA